MWNSLEHRFLLNTLVAASADIMQQICRENTLCQRVISTKLLCNFIEIAQAWVCSCKFTVYLQNNFLQEHLWRVYTPGLVKPIKKKIVTLQQLIAKKQTEGGGFCSFLQAWIWNRLHLIGRIINKNKGQYLLIFVNIWKVGTGNWTV